LLVLTAGLAKLFPYEVLGQPSVLQIAIHNISQKQ